MMDRDIQPPHMFEHLPSAGAFFAAVGARLQEASHLPNEAYHHTLFHIDADTSEAMAVFALAESFERSRHEVVEKLEVFVPINPDTSKGFVPLDLSDNNPDRYVIIKKIFGNASARFKVTDSGIEPMDDPDADIFEGVDEELLPDDDTRLFDLTNRLSFYEIIPIRRRIGRPDKN